MKNMTLYYWMSALSGCVWAILAYVLSDGAMGSLIWRGVIASPLIGLLIGLLYLPAYKFSKGWQVFTSLVTLYLAVALFGFAVGIYDAYGRSITNRIPSEVILESVLATLWGVTFLGYFLVLWPLSYLNHRLLARTQKAV
jgi:hypothetical protein